MCAGAANAAVGRPVCISAARSGGEKAGRSSEVAPVTIGSVHVKRP